MKTFTLEIWQAIYTNTEDIERKPVSIALIAGDDGGDCMRQALERESGKNEHAAPLPNSGAYMLHSLVYIGVVDIELAL